MPRPAPVDLTGIEASVADHEARIATLEAEAEARRLEAGAWAAKAAELEQTVAGHDERIEALEADLASDPVPAPDPEPDPVPAPDPAPPADSVSPAGIWSIETSGLSGGELSVSEADAVQTGVWQTGAPYNIDQIIKEAVVGDRVVGFRPDANGTRQEIPVYIGSLQSHPVVNQGEYTITVKRNGVAVGEPITIPSHWYRSRFRLVFEEIDGVWTRVTELPFRPVVASGADLIANKLLPPIGNNGINLDAYSPSLTPYTIMGAAGIARSMGGTGERHDIGPVTEHQARAMLHELGLPGGHPDAEQIAFHQAEAAGSIPWHYRDETTGRPVSIIDRPGITSHSNEVNDPDYVPMATGTGWSPDTAHQPALAYYPFMRTGDLYLLEELQAQAAWSAAHSKWGRSAGYGPQLQHMQVRGWAWALRNLFQCAKVSPATDATGVLLPASYFKTILANTLASFEGEQMTSTDPVHSVFRSLDDEWGVGGRRFLPWQQSFFTIIVGWAIEMGFTDWNDLHSWVLEQADAMTNGTSGWNRRVNGYHVYHQDGDGVQITTWPDLWALHVIDAGDPSPDISAGLHAPNGAFAYYSYKLAALQSAIRLGKTDPYQAIYDWLKSELDTIAAESGDQTIHAKYQWVAPAE